MMLSDTTIRRLVATNTIRVDPRPEETAYQPASIDLRLGYSFMTEGTLEPFEVEPGTDLRVAPGVCLLGCTLETIQLPNDIVARVEGKSTWGRRFLQIHATAGFIDPGFDGQITLELHNLSSKAPLYLIVGEPIAQISFHYLDMPAARPYGSPGLGSRYQGQTGATRARDVDRG